MLFNWELTTNKGQISKVSKFLNLIMNSVKIEGNSLCALSDLFEEAQRRRGGDLFIFGFEEKPVETGKERRHK